MNKFILSFLAFVAVLASPAHAGTLSATNAAQFRFDRGELRLQDRLGRVVLKHNEHVAKCTYDFAVAGGAISSINLKNEDGKDCVIPKSAIITQVYIDVITAGTTSASGTMALTAQSAGDLKAALAAASYTGILAGIPVGTAASAIKLTADRTIIGTIATGAFTAGKWNVLVEYIMSE